MLWTHAAGAKRAVGVKLRCHGAAGELAAFKFARQKSKFAGTMRGSYLVIRGDYPPPG